MNNTNTELERQIIREGLFQSLAAEGLDRDKCESWTENFDRLTDTGISAQYACQLVFSASGSQAAHQPVTRWIQNQLQQQIDQHPGIEKLHPLESLRRTIKKYNDRLQVLEGVSVEIGGKIHTLTQDELDNQVKAHLPHCMKKLETLTAKASEKHPLPRARAAKSLSIEVRYF